MPVNVPGCRGRSRQPGTPCRYRRLPRGMSAVLPQSCVSNLLLVFVYCRLSAFHVAASSDDSLRLEGGALIAKTELVAVCVSVVLAQQRGAVDLDGGVGQLDRAAGGGELPALRMVHPNDHLVGGQ